MARQKKVRGEATILGPVRDYPGPTREQRREILSRNPGVDWRLPASEKRRVADVFRRASPIKREAARPQDALALTTERLNMQRRRRR